jgi:hypothetical protein
MKIKQLIEELQKLNPEAEVLMSSDTEGNEYNSLSTIGTNHAYKGSGCDIEIGLEKLTAADKKAGCTEEDVPDGGKPCIILWP